MCSRKRAERDRQEHSSRSTLESFLCTSRTPDTNLGVLYKLRCVGDYRLFNKGFWPHRDCCVGSQARFRELGSKTTVGHAKYQRMYLCVWSTHIQARTVNLQKKIKQDRAGQAKAIVFRTFILYVVLFFYLVPPPPKLCCVGLVLISSGRASWRVFSQGTTSRSSSTSTGIYPLGVRRCLRIFSPVESCRSYDNVAPYHGESYFVFLRLSVFSPECCNIAPPSPRYGTVYSSHRAQDCQQRMAHNIERSAGLV